MRRAELGKSRLEGEAADNWQPLPHCRRCDAAAWASAQVIAQAHPSKAVGVIGRIEVFEEGLEVGLPAAEHGPHHRCGQPGRRGDEGEQHQQRLVD